ncbi:MAG: prepilin-type N-terminal cleavage/methylation domain-containing protein [Deltaproteobacteria bacterium]|nr:prepilin-type N-terminal cleavage/methylation domain-containing protein [Deltaproteobacteria bacterium]
MRLKNKISNFKFQISNSANNGFTLLELLIAVSIMSVVLTALYGSFFSVLSSQEKIENELERTREIRRFLDIFSLEIQSSFFKDNNSRTIFAGGKKGSYNKPFSEVLFTAFTYPLIRGGYPVSDLLAVQYSVQENTDEVLTLYKKTWNPYTGDGKDGLSAEVVEGVEGFEVSYFNGKDWAKTWDSSLEKKLPEAVRVVIAVKDRGEVREFSTIVRTRIR